MAMYRQDQPHCASKKKMANSQLRVALRISVAIIWVLLLESFMVYASLGPYEHAHKFGSLTGHFVRPILVVGGGFASGSTTTIAFSGSTATAAATAGLVFAITW